MPRCRECWEPTWVLQHPANHGRGFALSVSSCRGLVLGSMGACGEAEGSVVLDVSSACGGWDDLDRLGGEQRLCSSVAAGKRWEVQHMKCKADFGVSCWAWSLWGPMRSPSEAPSFSYEIIHCKLAVCIKALCSGVLGCSEWDAVWCCSVLLSVVNSLLRSHARLFLKVLVSFVFFNCSCRSGWLRCYEGHLVSVCWDILRH